MRYRGKSGRSYRFLLAAVLFVMSLQPVFANDESDLQDLQDQQSQVNAQQQENGRQLQEAEKKVNDAIAAVEQLDQKIQESESRIAALDQKIEENLKTLDQAKQDLVEAEAEEHFWYQALKQRIQLMYETGDVSYLEVLLKAESLSDLFSKLEYSRELAAKDQEIMENLKTAREKVEQHKAAIEEEEARLEENRKDEEAEKQKLDEAKEEKDAELEVLRSDAEALALYQQHLNALEMQIQQQIADKEQEIQERKAREEEERRQREQAEREAEESRQREEEQQRQQQEQGPQQQTQDSKQTQQPESQPQSTESSAPESENKDSGKSDEGSTTDKTSTNDKSDESGKNDTSNKSENTGNSGASSSSSGLSWPLPGYTYISSGFYSRISPITGKQEQHRGIDIPAPAGTPIRAAGSGTVITAGWNISYGNYVMISHGNGLVTLYAHSSKLNVSAGQTVSTGDTIAFVGSTGDSTGNHLHFEVRLNGVLQQPLDYV